MNIRVATLNDIGAIMHIVRAIVPVMQEAGNLQWDNVYPNAAVFINDVSQNQLWVADVEGDIAGFIAITTDQSEEYVNVGWDINEQAIVTHRLAVSLDHRKKGVAEALLAQAEVVAASRGIGILRIDTNSNNQATRKLFPKLGYVFSGETGLKFRPNLLFYCFEKRIS